MNIPPKGVFVIAQSMVAKNKAASNDFNARVVECRLASLVSNSVIGNTLSEWITFFKILFEYSTKSIHFGILSLSIHFHNGILELNWFQIIAKKLKLNKWHEYKKLADVQNSLDYDLGKMLQVVSEIFHGNYYTKDEVNMIFSNAILFSLTEGRVEKYQNSIQEASNSYKNVFEDEVHRLTY